MTDEIELISDGDGVAIFGDPAAVERFLAVQNLPSRQLPPKLLRRAMSTGSAVAQAASEVSANAGRWVQLTPQSAQIMQSSALMKGSADGVNRAIAVAKDGHITNILEFSKGSGQFLTNPAVLAGVGGVMAQYALQQAMEEISEYLKVIDAKVDDILRAQKDGVLADMIGVGLVIEEAMSIRGEVGRVSEVTWSKVQGTSMVIARTQAYALQQLDGLAEKLEQNSDASGLKKAATAAQTVIQEWLAVLARCFQLQDAIAVLELDRVLDASPEQLEQHRVGLRAARRNRLEVISRSTSQLVARVDSAGERANTKMFHSPFDARSVIRSSNHVASIVVEFQGLLGIEQSHEALEAKRWRVAAVEAKDKAIDTGSAVGTGVAVAVAVVGRQFRSVDLDGDGEPEEARALTVVKGAGSAVAGAAGAVGAVGARIPGIFKSRKQEPSGDE